VSLVVMVLSKSRIRWTGRGGGSILFWVRIEEVLEAISSIDGWFRFLTVIKTEQFQIMRKTNFVR